MIQMQRSSSLPGPAHISHPLSSTIAQHSSRGATPSPFGRPIHAQQPRGLSSTEQRTNYVLESGGSKTPFQVTGEAASSKESPALSSNISKPLSSVPHRPLLENISQYTNGHLAAEATGNVSTTLEELAHLVRLSTYQERKRSQSRIRLQRALVSTALSARLARCGELAHRTLVDNFRADDKKNFALLYNAVHDVKNSCDASRRYSLLEPDLDLGRPKDDPLDEPGSFSTFMHEIPSQSRDVILQFLSQIRTDPEFLASRISSLTSSELSALLLFHQGMEPIDSVLPFRSRSKTHSSSSNRNSTQIPSPVERLLSFQRHDPLSALIHTCFANSAGPDSAEDLRRTDTWATVCARLITESKGGTDPFICSVLNIWTSMRDWSGRSNMEWYLMKILQDGAFLLEKAEDQAGTRIHVEPRNAKDSIAADEFYETAITGLFEVIDDPGAGGVPEGLVELGNAILRKLDPKKHNAARLFLVSKWLFSVFLLNAIIHPESYGMMAEYHITEYGRQKILKEVALRAQKLVVDLTWKKTGATPPEIRTHIESIMSRFRSSKHPRTNAKLLPARSITSLRETVEVHPYLVISPSDIVTLVNALYPERRPVSSSLEKDMHFNGLRSAASSISGMSAVSVPMAMPPPSRSFDAASIVSNSGSSITSDTTSREPLLDDGFSNTNRFSSTSISSMSQSPRSEDEGHKLRAAIREMSHVLGSDVTSGSCHPCAEHWAVLFMNANGQHLSTQMLHDIQDDGDEEDDSSGTDDDYERDELRPDLDKEYHQLRDSILKLVEDYEIPQTSNTNNSMTFSNRTGNLENPMKNNHARSRPEGANSRNPYRNTDPSPSPKAHQISSSPHRPISHRHSGSGDSASDSKDNQPPVLLRMLEAAERQCQAQSDFVNAHLYWRTSQQLHQISSPSLVRGGFVSLLNIFSRGPRDSIRRSASAIEDYDAWLVWLKQSQERHDIIIESMMKRLIALRDKTWYVTDVRNSAAYEGARNVAVALKSMAAPKTNRYLQQSGGRPRNISRSSTNNFLLKTEAQVLDILAASEDHGGPNKLSDEQSEKTLKWLSQLGIENFCKGEERIHRFCLEVETCISKLVGDSLMEGPVLWSSDLYLRDKRILDGGRQKGDIILTGLGGLTIANDSAAESDSGRRSLRGLDMPSTSRPRDLRSMSTRNGSQQSFDSGRWSMSRASTTTGDIMDSQDYFGMASPVLTIDSATTFWSPFQTRVQSPSTSVGSFRPGTASTTNETVMHTSGDTSGVVAKQEFLADLKKTLTSLLISDLGTLIFARGSETDSWFSGDLGQECMERRGRQDRKLRKKSKKRVIEKKKSFRDLRLAHMADLSGSETQDSNESRSDKPEGASRLAKDGLVTGSDSLAESTSTTDSSQTSTHNRPSKELVSLDFPYKASFRRLLRMFSVHPNPYVKLNALFELEHLIVVSFATMPRRKVARHEHNVYSPSQAEYGIREGHKSSSRANNINEAIDSCRERRLSTLLQVETSPPMRRAVDTRPFGAPVPASTDMIVDVLQDLFREAGMRPKTLFRDLQFIAAFVPAHILDKTDKGKAFWDAGLAALGLKQDVCRTLIEIADEIVLYYTQTRQTSNNATGSAEQKDRAEVMQYSMQDAARMWTITAKEGDPVAERELAIFYLTHPELVERTTLPLSKPLDTFKPQVMEMHGASSGGGFGGGGWGGGGGGGKEKDGDKERGDPMIMCFATHWMSLSARGGDELAKKYLRQREEMSALP